MTHPTPFRLIAVRWLALALLLLASGRSMAVDLVNGLGNPPIGVTPGNQNLLGGFGEGVLNRDDDGSSVLVDLSPAFPEGLRFFGTTYTQVWVNMNGNLTFGNALAEYTPDDLTTGGNPRIIAAFHADVDTRVATAGTTSPMSPGGKSSGSDRVYYDVDAATGIATFTWDDVGYFRQHTDKVNAFQIRLISRGGGGFDMEFRYEAINWTTGDASGGTGGLGGTVARAGYTAGTGAPGTFAELPQSGIQAQMLALPTLSNLTPPVAGLFGFEVRVPTLVITPAGTATNADPITFRLTFSQPVTGLAVGDIAVTGGVAGTLTPVGAGVTHGGAQYYAEYDLTVTPDADGPAEFAGHPVTVTVAADVATNTFGNGNTVGTATVTSDRTAPTLVSVTTPIAAPTETGASPIPFTYTFSEAVTGFGAADVVLSAGTGSITTSGSGTTWTARVSPTLDGTYTAGLNGTGVTDLAGNAVSASGATASAESDRTGPQLVITRDPSGLATNDTSIVYTFTFTDGGQVPVTGFTASDVSVSNGSRGELLGGPSQYTMTITPNEGTVVVRVASNACVDALGNGNFGASDSVVFDTTGPTATIVPDEGSWITNDESMRFTVTFSEPWVGLLPGEFTVVNGVASALDPVASTGNLVYTLSVTASGPLSVSLPAGVCTDALGNPNAASTVANVGFDAALLTLDISPDLQIRDTAPILFTFEFASPVTGFTRSDVVVANGSADAGDFIAVDGDTYTLAVTPGQGQVTVTVPANRTTPANRTARATMTYDTRAPRVTISASPSRIRPGISTTLTFAWSEPVDFDEMKLSVTGAGSGPTGVVQVDERTYRATFTAAAQTLVIAGAVGVGTDLATNESAAFTYTVTGSSSSAGGGSVGGGKSCGLGSSIAFLMLMVMASLRLGAGGRAARPRAQG